MVTTEPWQYAKYFATRPLSQGDLFIVATAALLINGSFFTALADLDVIALAVSDNKIAFIFLIILFTNFEQSLIGFVIRHELLL